MRRLTALVVLALIAGFLPIVPGTAFVGRATAAEPATAPASASASPGADASPDVPAGPDGATAATPAAVPASQPIATTTWISSGQTSSVVGHLTNYSIGIDPAPDGGTLTLEVDGTPVSSVDMGAGWAGAMLGWTPSAPGTYTVQAVYGGTAAYAASSSGLFSTSVPNTPPDSVTVTSSANPVARNADVTFTATVSPDPGDGSVEWRVGGVLVETDPLSSGVATMTTSFASVGTEHITATFTGNASWSPRPSDFFYEDVSGDPVTVAIALPPDPILAGPVSATVTVTPDPAGGTITWRWSDFDLWGHDTPVGPGGVTTLDLGTLYPGSRHLEVRFSGYDQLAAGEADTWFQVLGPSSVSLTASSTSAVVGELPVTLTATVTLPEWAQPGTVTFVDDVGGVVVEFGPFAVDGATFKASYASSSLRVGSHSIRARFNGVVDVAGSISDPVIVSVVADTAVHASFTASMTTFYPYRDGYRDTVSLGGTLNERASVTIRVYASTGSLRRTWSLGTRNAGKYTVTWNGRTSSGTAVAAGKYTVRASFRDVLGHTRTITVYTTVSWRQAKWVTATAVTRYGDQLAYYATGDLLYYSPDYSRGRTMDAGPMYRDCDPGCAEIFGTTAFQLRTTGVLAYRSVLIAVVGHGYADREHTGTAYVVHPGTGAWDVSATLPEYIIAGQTTNIVVSANQISSTKRVTIALDCIQMWGDAFDLHYLRLTYQYAVWK